ncbi:MAG: UDP-N-acetylmuramoyl-L-alanine--D-glutamate ligase [Patescibacteria group bacterium]
MSSLAGKKVLILGLGQYPKGSGIAAALYALEQGADVLVTDQKPEKDIADNVKRLKEYSNVKFRLGCHKLKDIEWADVIIRNPRVRPGSPEMQLATKLGKKIESDITLFLSQCPAKVIGVTGTRGKSTTSTLIAKMLKNSDKKVWLGGNILVSPLTFLNKVKKDDYVILELSSWQTETLGMVSISPHIACITNIMADHLNSYEGMEDYAEAKSMIFRFQTGIDTVILNGDDGFCRDWAREAPGMVKFFTKQKEYASSAWLTAASLIFKDKKEREIVKKEELKVHGEHMYINMLAASLVASIAGAKRSAIRQTLLQFKGLSYRQEVVARKKGIIFVNDTTATTPDGTMAALRAFGSGSGTLRLILGGADKELDFSNLGKELKKLKTDIAVLPGSAEKKIFEALRQNQITFQKVESLNEAVKNLVKRSVPGDVVILSPGCASFGLFKNEFDRGDKFNALVKARSVIRK